MFESERRRMWHTILTLKSQVEALEAAMKLKTPDMIPFPPDDPKRALMDLQRTLGVNPDGIFGLETLLAIPPRLMTSYFRTLSRRIKALRTAEGKPL